MCMNTYTDTFTNVSVHFDDAETSFSALQNSHGNVFVTDETWQSLKAQGFNMDEEDAPVALHPGEYAGLRDISDFPINFDDIDVRVEACQIGPVGGHSNREWCSVHKSYANEPWSADALCPR